MLEQLRNVNVDRLDMDELMALSAFGTNLKAEYTANNVEIPEWLDDATRKVKRQISERNADAMANRVRHIEQKLESLKTPAERRAELEAELAKLKGATA